MNLKVCLTVTLFLSACAETSIEELGCAAVQDADALMITATSIRDGAPTLETGNYRIVLQDIPTGYGGHIRINLDEDSPYALFFSRVVDVAVRTSSAQIITPDVLQTTVLTCPDELKQYAVYDVGRGTMAVEFIASSDAEIMLGIAPTQYVQ